MVIFEMKEHQTGQQLVSKRIEINSHKNSENVLLKRTFMIIISHIFFPWNSKVATRSETHKKAALYCCPGGGNFNWTSFASICQRLHLSLQHTCHPTPSFSTYWTPSVLPKTKSSKYCIENPVLSWCGWSYRTVHKHRKNRTKQKKQNKKQHYRKHLRNKQNHLHC